MKNHILNSLSITLLSTAFTCLPITTYAVDSTSLGAPYYTVGPTTYILAVGTSHNTEFMYYNVGGREYWTLRMYTGLRQCASGTIPYVQTQILWAQSPGNEGLKFISLEPGWSTRDMTSQPTLQWIGYAYEIPIFIKTVGTSDAFRSSISFSWVLYCYANTQPFVGDTFVY